MIGEIFQPNEIIFYRQNMTRSHPCLRIKLISMDELNPIDQMNPVYDLCPNAMTCICYSCWMTQLEEFFFLVAKWNNWMKLHDISVNLIYHHLKFVIIHAKFISSIEIHVDCMNEHRISSSIKCPNFIIIIECSCKLHEHEI